MKRWGMMTVAALIAVAGGSNVVRAADVTLTGAGSTFAKPLYDQWSADYNKTNPDVRINYQGIGSGGGIKQITGKTVDFGATDMPMTDEQLSKAKGLLHIPTAMGAVVPIYHVSGVNKPLVFDGNTLAGIYEGKMIKWNDSAIAKTNPGVALPDEAITVVHRSDGSGTTFVLTDYLSKVNQDWNNGPGASTTINWPVGRGAKGNDGVAADVKQNEGSFGYVELIYAANNGISYGDVMSAGGKPVHASAESVSAAAASVKDVPDDLRFSITDAPGDDAFPISSLTWILVDQNQRKADKGTALVKFLWWGVHDGQAAASSLHYAPLPKELLPKIEAKLKSIKVDGKPVIE